MSPSDPNQSRRRREPLRSTTAQEEPMATIVSEPDIERSEPRADRSAAMSRFASSAAFRPQSATPTVIGIGVAIMGFILLAVAWGGVAGEDDVAMQVPYLISGGAFGLGLIMVGLTIVNMAAKRRDAAMRAQQIELLAAALQELREGDR